MIDLEIYRPQIEAALSYDGEGGSFEDVAAAIQRGDLQVWPGANSVIITHIVREPWLTTLHFYIAGGVLEELEQMTPNVLAWGKTQGCTRASLYGRPGWERTFLARTGWNKSRLICMEKDLG